MNKPTNRQKITRDDLRELSRGIGVLSKDFENFSDDQRQQLKEETAHFNRVATNIERLQSSFRSGAGKLVSATHATASTVKSFASEIRNKVTQEVNVDHKQNVSRIATALMGPMAGIVSQSLFGSETAQRLKDSAKNKVSQSYQKIREKWQTRKPRTSNRQSVDAILSETGELRNGYHNNQSGVSQSNINKAITDVRPKVPRARSGGYVRHGGLAEVHHGEQIVPKKQLDSTLEVLTAMYKLQIRSENIKRKIQRSDLVNDFQNRSLTALESMSAALSGQGDAKQEGPLATLGNLFKFYLPGLSGGMYRNDIPKSTNPLVTMTSGILEMYRWQRLYGELTRRQLNELIKMGGGEQQELKGKRGILLEVYVRNKKRIFQKLQASLERNRQGQVLGPVRPGLAGIGDRVRRFGSQISLGAQSAMVNLFDPNSMMNSILMDDPEEFEMRMRDRYSRRLSRNLNSEQQIGTSDLLAGRSAETVRRARRRRKKRNVNDNSFTPGSVDRIVTTDGTSVEVNPQDVVTAETVTNRSNKASNLWSRILIQLKNITRNTGATAKFSQWYGKITARKEKILESHFTQQRRDEMFERARSGGRRAGNMISDLGKFAATLGASGIVALTTFLTLLIKNPKGTLEALRWSVSSTDNIAKSFAILPKIYLATKGLGQMIGGFAKMGSVIGKAFASVSTVGLKAASKTALVAGKMGLKTLKLVPGLGLVIGTAFALSRLNKGDYVGAVGELASGIATTVPVFGTAVSLVIDACLIARDIRNLKKIKPVSTPGGSGHGVIGSALRITPGLGLIFGITDSLKSFRSGHYGRGLTELTRGIASTFPGAGTVIAGFMEGLIQLSTRKKINVKSGSGDGVKDFFMMVLGIVKDAVMAIPRALFKSIAWLTKLTFKAINGVTKLIFGSINGVFKLLKKLTNGIGNLIVGLSNSVHIMKDKIVGGFKTFWSSMTGIGPWLREKYTNFLNSLFSGSLLSNVKEASVDMAKSIADGFRTLFDSIIDWLTSPNALSAAARSGYEKVKGTVVNGARNIGETVGYYDRRDRRMEEHIGTAITRKQADLLAEKMSDTDKLKDIGQALNKRKLKGQDRLMEVIKIVNLYKTAKDPDLVTTLIKRGMSADRAEKTIKETEFSKATESKNPVFLSKLTNLCNKYGRERVIDLYNRVGNVHEVMLLLTATSIGAKEKFVDEYLSLMQQNPKNSNLIIDMIAKGWEPEKIRKALNIVAASSSKSTTESIGSTGRIDRLKKELKLVDEYIEINRKLIDNLHTQKNSNPFYDVDLKTNTSRITELQLRGKQIQDAIEIAKRVSPSGETSVRQVNDWIGKAKYIISSSGEIIKTAPGDVVSSLKKMSPQMVSEIQSQVAEGNIDPQYTEGIKQNRINAHINEARSISTAMNKLGTGIKEHSAETVTTINKAMNNIMNTTVTTINNGNKSRSSNELPFWRTLDHIITGVNI